MFLFHCLCFSVSVCVSVLRLFWEDQVQLTRSEACALPAWQAVHCAMHTAQPPLDRHQPVAILVETSGCCRRGSRLICKQVSLPPSGGAPDRSAPVQVCGLAPLARLTVLLALGAPLRQSAASALPEGSHSLMPRKNLFREFWFCHPILPLYLSPEAAHRHVYAAIPVLLF